MKYLNFFGKIIFSVLVLSITFTGSRATNFSVTTIADAGAGSLRQAIINANADPAAPHTITFALAAGSTIILGSNLPPFERQITVNGGTLNNIIINGAGTVNFPFLFSNVGGSGSTLQNLVINGFTDHGILIVNPVTNITVSSCRIGTNATGTAASSNNIGIGVYGNLLNNIIIENSQISGNTNVGININDISAGRSVIIRGCIIGLNAARTARIPNGGNGINMTNVNGSVTIGGAAAANGNYISGNGIHGIFSDASTAAQLLLIQNNYIGAGLSGTTGGVGNTAMGLQLVNTANVRVLNNTISANTSLGAQINNCPSVIATSNFIGLGANGTTSLGNGNIGIQFISCVSITFTNNFIGNNNSSGVQIINSASPLVQGNRSGITSGNPGVSASNNGVGIHIINCTNFTVGGTAAGQGNIISSNTDSGLTISNGSTTGTVYGNYIGTNALGLGTTFGNVAYGIHLYDAYSVNIGNGTAAGRNVICKNGFHGIYYEAGAGNSVVRGNYIGIGSDGTTSIGNLKNGISGVGAATVTIGGAAVGDRNVISCNGSADTDAYSGISFTTTSNLIVTNNTIGLDATRLLARPNSNFGVWLVNNPNFIVSNNLISGNGVVDPAIGDIARSGIQVANNQVGTGTITGNIIGLNDAGAVLANRGNGINIIYSTAITVGGTTVASRNIISGNRGFGILLANSSANFIYGNSIGTNAAGTATNLGNGAAGIFVVSQIPANAYDVWSFIPTVAANSERNSIGGLAAGQGNFITYNGSRGTFAGVHLDDAGSRYNPIRGNAISCNTGKGINLNGLGNQNIAAPVINPSSTLANVYGSGLTAGHFVDIYELRACDNCSKPQGYVYKGTATVQADGTWAYTGGVSNFNITATVTKNTANQQNTSEFATCTTLPIVLVSFEAHAVENNSVSLTWTTSQEINNHHFSILKSVDGINFVEIGTVTGQGTTSNVTNYTYTDNEVRTGTTYFYKLKQVDFNGTSEESAIRSVTLTNSLAPVVYPNPAENKVAVRMNSSEFSVKVKVEMYDVLGKLYFEDSFSEKEFSLDLTEYAPGVYTMVIKSENSIFNQKLIKK